MKIKDGYILSEVAGNCLVVPLCANTTFSGMLRLNETGKLLWEALQKDVTEEELVAALLAEYEIDEATARADVSRFLDSLHSCGALEK